MTDFDPHEHDRETPRLRRVLDALTAHPRVVFAVRQNTGGAWFQGRYVAFGYQGAADITGMLLGGRRIDVEVKRPGQWPTPEKFAKWLAEGPATWTKTKRRLIAQRANLHTVNDGGGLGFIAYDVGCVYAQLGEPADALAEPGAEDRYRRALVQKALESRSRRGGRGRWTDIPAHLKFREQ